MSVKTLRTRGLKLRTQSLDYYHKSTFFSDQYTEYSSALQASAPLREASSSRSTSPVQFEGETLLPPDDPARKQFSICVY